VKLSRLNTCLLVAIIAINSYIIAMPFIPGIVFWYQSRHSDTKKVLTTQLDAPVPVKKPNNTTPYPSGDRLIIPSMLLDVPYFEGRDARTLNKGPWLRPNGSTPEKAGNTVIAGHRFTYTNPRGEFYHLDKVKVGDKIGMFRKEVRYIYIVREIKIVGPNEVSIEAPTETPQLTLYTCTPLWLPKDRLVVIATPQGGNTDGETL
jgi:LPXTG-site transpeptidase (sortase) family protein